jgi:hypothetical protein
MNFEIESVTGACESIEVQPAAITIAGWTGRDPLAVQKHIDELAALGVKPPKEVPVLYPAGRRLLTRDEVIEVVGAHSSGEAEFCLFAAAGELYVAVGSDHTDRELEVTSVLYSKQVCPKPISRRCWRLHEVIDHWDELRLRSYVSDGSSEHVYQDASVREILHPNDLLLRAFSGERHHDGQIVFSGTVPTIGEIRASRHFRAELVDPVLGRTLACSYTTKDLRS